MTIGAPRRRLSLPFQGKHSGLALVTGKLRYVMNFRCISRGGRVGGILGFLARASRMAIPTALLIPSASRCAASDRYRDAAVRARGPRLVPRKKPSPPAPSTSPDSVTSQAHNPARSQRSLLRRPRSQPDQGRLRELLRVPPRPRPKSAAAPAAPLPVTTVLPQPPATPTAPRSPRPARPPAPAAERSPHAAQQRHQAHWAY